MADRCVATLDSWVSSATCALSLWALLALSVSSMAGCRSTDLVGNDCELNGRPCPDPLGGGGEGGSGDAFDTLDLLFVIDNGPSMADKQRELAQAIPTMINALLSGQLGSRQFSPVTDLHVAVVSTDMGAPGVVGLDDCGEDTGSPLGDDGIFLQTQSDVMVAGESCQTTPTTPEFVSFVANETDVEAMSQVAGCRALIGDDGCSHAMPLEAALKALFNRPNNDTFSFANGSGHGAGDTAQGTFVRDDALLAVIIVTNNEDCSLRDVTPLTPSDQLGDADFAVDRALRCWKAGDALYNLGRYQTGFGLIKGGREDRLFLGVIAGVPQDLVTLLNSTGVAIRRDVIFEQILDDPRMQYTPVRDEVTDTIKLKTSCGDAVPPRRLVELTRRLETSGQLGSICDDVMTPMQMLTAELVRRVDPLAQP